MRVLTTTDHVTAALEHLQAVGTMHRECIVLWLGKRRDDDIHIVETLCPEQQTDFDMFYLPPRSLDSLQTRLRSQRLMVAAQIHSHPRAAFHSAADDKWAIVRHVGALSIVVPDFALLSHVATFLDFAKVFRFSDEAKWLEVSSEDIGACLQID